ncbi:hypothetical protein Tco_0320466 [Tanacetum coccineum]
MVSTSNTDKGKNKSQVTIPALRVLNPTRTMKREKSKEPDSRGWYLNSRAIRHVCNSRDMFVEFRRLFHEKRVMQDTDGVDVDGVGKVAISFKSGEVLILSNVLYVPTMKINLLSTNKLDYDGYTFHYKGKEVVIKEGRELVGKGYDTCGLYRLSINNDWPDAIVKLD